MKKHLPGMFLVLVLLLGIGILLYPMISNRYSMYRQSHVIRDYETSAGAMADPAADRMLREAREYNDALGRLSFPMADFLQVPGYEEILDVSGTGAMCYLKIPRIHVELPVYHGTDSSVLDVGIGHVQGSSLPVGGPGTHCVLSAHRGLPSARLFTDLDKLEIGDCFQIVILGRIHEYCVDQILVVEPEETQALGICRDEDYCTLVTCTPYGVNTHRLLVRGSRVQETAPEQPVTEERAPSYGPVILIAAVVPAAVLWLCLRRKKKIRP